MFVPPVGSFVSARYRGLPRVFRVAAVDRDRLVAVPVGPAIGGRAPVRPLSLPLSCVLRCWSGAAFRQDTVLFTFSEQGSACDWSDDQITDYLAGRIQ